MSCDRIARSASFPAAIVPLSFSIISAYAEPRVYASTASSRVIASAELPGSVVASMMLRPGFAWAVGADRDRDSGFQQRLERHVSAGRIKRVRNDVRRIEDDDDAEFFRQRDEIGLQSIPMLEAHPLLAPLLGGSNRAHGIEHRRGGAIAGDMKQRLFVRFERLFHDGLDLVGREVEFAHGFAAARIRPCEPQRPARPACRRGSTSFR